MIRKAIDYYGARLRFHPLPKGRGLLAVPSALPKDKLPKLIIDFLTVDELLNYLVKLGQAFPRGQDEYEIRVANVGNQAAFFAKLQMMSGAYENSGPN